jgi:hypothetical protein
MKAPRDSAAPVASVVIPACNAEATLAATLESALAQTCRDIEIIVVNDGSHDRTSQIAAAYAARDPRLRLVEQPNGGVARARNRGVTEARGAFVAPLDADDLWRPEKLASQLDTFRRGGPNVGLVYSWSLLIDADGQVTGALAPAQIEGYVLHRLLAWNFVGNGSAPLLPTELLRRHGYDPSLRDAGCEGGEDYLMQLRIAREHAFACAPGYLIGYRRTPDSMSANALAMDRSVGNVFARVAPELSGFARAVARTRRSEYLVREAATYLQARRWVAVAGRLIAAGFESPALTGEWVLDRVLRRRLFEPAPPAEGLYEFGASSAAEAPANPEPELYRKMAARLEQADQCDPFTPEFGGETLKPHGGPSSEPLKEPRSWVDDPARDASPREPRGPARRVFAEPSSDPASLPDLRP